MFFAWSLLFVMLSTSLSFAQTESPKTCSVDEALRKLGWVEHSEQELPSIWQRFEETVQTPSYKKDIETIYPSDELKSLVHFISFDSSTTPEEEMFGDVAFYREEKSNKPLEIRWYEGGKKHFSHFGSRCSVDTVPLAENALF